MSQYEDQIAKLILQGALEESGQVLPELEIPVLDAQSGDLFFLPGPGARPQQGAFSLLGRMTRERCLWEPYSQTPGRELLTRGCLRKQMQLYHNFCLEAERKELPLPPLQQMWVVSPGRPNTVLEVFGCQPLAGYPAGFHTMAAGFAVGIVVLSELPRTTETILLRLLGGPRMRQEALAEMRRLPEDEADRKELASTITRAGFMIERDPKLPRQDKDDFMNAVNAEFESFKQSLIDKGIERGIDKGRAQSVVDILELRGIPISNKARARILACADLDVVRGWLARALAATSTDELFAD